MEFNFNKYLTPLTEELMVSLPEEVLELLIEIITTIPFVKSLISPDRKYAKDLPRDEKGRIKVDITNPHILEDMDYFRQPALHFMKHGCYTFLKPNSNPNSEYRKFWDEEIRRCREGYVRESDGEWITGLNYWFLNYCPMMVNVSREGSNRADRIEAFPYFFEGIYWRYHYIEQARDNGNHCIELAKRGAHPYSEKVYTPNGVKSWKDIKVGDKLYGTYGNITTVTDIPFDDIADVYKVTLDDGRVIYSSDDHLWKVGVSTRRNISIKSTLEMYSDPNFRLKSTLYKYAIPENMGVDFDNREVPIDPYTFGLLLGDGTFRHEVIELALSKQDYEEIKLYIPYNTNSCDQSGIHYIVHIPNWRNILRQLGLYKSLSINKFIPDIYKYNSRLVRLAVLLGLLDSDGWCSAKRSPLFCTISEKLKDDVLEVARSLGYRAVYVKKRSGYRRNDLYIECNDSYIVTIKGHDELFKLKRKRVMAAAAPNTFRKFSSITNIEYIGKDNCKCVTVDSLDSCYLISDFVTTHNCGKSYGLSSIMTRNLILGESEISHRRVMTILLGYLKDFLQDGKDGTLSKFRPSLNFISSNTPFPRLLLKNSPNEMIWQMGYKDEFGIEKGSLNTVMAVSMKDDASKARGKRGILLFEEMGSMPNLLTVYNVCRKSVEDGNNVYGLMILVGTAAEKESDFSAAKTMLYNPNGYNIMALPDVWDFPKLGKKNFGFFFPAYINRARCYNKDGVSDVIKALIEVLLFRYKTKYNTTDVLTLLTAIAEDPITPAEAIIKVKATFFPTVALTERLTLLDSNPHIYDDIYIGLLVLNNEGKVVFKPTSDIPIRKYPVDNDTPGAIEIYEMPEIDKHTDKPYAERYIIGHDPKQLMGLIIVIL